MGRPTKPAEEKRTERLAGVRVTTAERIDLESRAEAAGLALMDYQRQALFAAKVIAPKSVGDGRLLVELNRAGVNLNQITRSINRGQPIGDEARLVLARLYDVLERIGRAHGA